MNNKFTQTYLEVINQQNQIINQGVADFFTNLFNFDKFKTALNNLTSLDAQKITEAGTAEAGKQTCQNAANGFISQVPLFEKCKQRLTNVGNNIGKKIKEKSENILVKGKNGNKELQGISQKTAGGAKAGIKKGLQDQYDTKIKSYTNRQLIIQNVQNNTDKSFYIQCDKNAINQFKLFVEECALHGITPNKLFNINARRAKQKPIVFEDVIYTFKTTKTSLICQKKNINDNKLIIYENNNFTNNTVIKTYQNNKLIYQEVTNNESNSQTSGNNSSNNKSDTMNTVVTSLGTGAVAGGTVAGVVNHGKNVVTKSKGIWNAFKSFILKIWSILQTIIDGILKILLTIIYMALKLIADVIQQIIPASKKIFAAIRTATGGPKSPFTNPYVAAGAHINGMKGLTKFILACLFAVFCILLYSLISNTQQQKTQTQSPENTSDKKQKHLQTDNDDDTEKDSTQYEYNSGDSQLGDLM